MTTLVMSLVATVSNDALETLGMSVVMSDNPCSDPRHDLCPLECDRSLYPCTLAKTLACWSNHCCSNSCKTLVMTLVMTLVKPLVMILAPWSYDECVLCRQGRTRTKPCQPYSS